MCVLGRFRRESPREARTGRFLCALRSRGVAWFLRRCYCGVVWWRLMVVAVFRLLRLGVVGWLCESGVCVCVSM